MAFLGLRVPHEVARLFGDVEVPGVREDLSFLHVTILHLGKNVPLETIARAMVAVGDITAEAQPFKLIANRVTSFPPGEDGTPIICPVESKDLHELRDRLARNLDVAGVQFSKKFKIFRPHVTLAYGDETIEDRRIPTIEWSAHELVLWGGDEGDQRIVVNFPFTLSLAQRIARRFQRLP